MSEDLPAGWRRERLADVCQVVSGATPQTGVEAYWGGDIAWLTPDDLSRHDGKYVEGGRRSLSRAGYDSCSTRLVPPGSVLYSSRAPIGYAAIAMTEMCTNQGFKTAVPGSTIDSSYLYWHLVASTEEIKSRASGTTFLEVSGKTFGNTWLNIPTLEEQRRIVAVLEDHLSCLEAAEAYLMAALGRARAWFNALRDEQLTINSVDTLRLDDLLERVEAGRSFGGAAPPAQAEQWGVLRVSAMTWGEFRPDENKAVPGDLVDPRWEVRPGDVLVSRANTSEYVGAPVLVREVRPRLLLSDKSLRLVPREGVDPEWLVHALGSTGARRQVSDLASGTKDSMRNISQANLRSITLPRADRQQQAAAVSGVSEAAVECDRLRVQLGYAHQRGAALRRALLAAAFSGRL